MPDDELNANDNTDDSNETGDTGLAEGLYTEEADDSESDADNKDSVDSDNQTDDEENAQDSETDEEEVEGVLGKKRESASETDDKDGDEKPDDDEGTPEEINLTLSEDSPLNEGNVEGVFDFAEADKLGQKEAEDLLGLVESAVTEKLDQHAKDKPARDEATINKASDDWLEAAQNDPVIGGKNFKGIAADANKLLTTEFSPEFSELMEKSGAGNHPVILRDMALFYRKYFAEDKFNPGGDKPEQKEVGLAESLFGPNPT